MRRPHLIRALIVVAATVLPFQSMAEESREVTLRMKGGGFQVTGEIRFFDGTKYVVESPRLGKLTLQAARFECVGAACNTPATAAAWTYEPLSLDRHETVTIRGSELIGQQLMPALLRTDTQTAPEYPAERSRNVAGYRMILSGQHPSRPQPSTQHFHPASGWASALRVLL